LSTLGFTQNLSNLRQKSFVLKSSYTFDTLSIVPGSEIFYNAQNLIIPDSLYSINYSKSTISSKSKAIVNQKTTLIYRVFPMNFSDTYFDKNLRFDSVQQSIQQPYNPNPSKFKTKKKPESTLQVNGNISRGFIVGNSQNTTINSNLNLQLSGEISKDLYIDAMLSDKNIPIQPDGYTQQIQEFDQVYIRIYDSIRSLKMGDVEITGQNSHFLKFNRRILGGDFMHEHIQISENVYASSQISTAVSKGNFNRTEFTGIEGVQGPYLLTGANNETYIVILAATEKIYLDGILLERGENADYVVNYNTAELTFTPKHFITKDSRIITEFEYSDKNYNRFVLYTQNQINYKNGSLSVQYFNEGDAKNQPVNLLLTDKHKQILANAGDDPMQAIVSNIDSTSFDINLVQYKLVDTLVNGLNYDSILVYSNHPDSAFYKASFALVGSQNGNYIQEITAANGKVFRWLAPINGIPQGNYEPVQLLIAPKKKEMLVAKSIYKINNRTQALIELAFSNNDENTFSDKNSKDNKGWALKNRIDHSIAIKTKTLNLSLDYELKNKNFNPIESYRNAEFQRDWNIEQPYLYDEHFLQAQTSLLDKKKQLVTFNSEILNYGTNYQGFRNELKGNTQFHKLSITGKVSLLNTHTKLNQSQFYRHNIKVIRPVWKVKLGLLHDFENNILQLIKTDSLLSTSQKYSLAEAFLTNNDSSKNSFTLRYKNRLDFLPLKNKLTQATESNDVIFSSNIGSGNSHNLKSSLIWRNLEIKNEEISTQTKNEQNLLGRIDHNLILKKRVLTFSTFYEIGTGVESRKEYSYIAVAAGQGIYVWVDYNSNDIPELNEFEISPFPEEANYIRIYTPTNDYIKVYSLKLNETIRLNPARIWRNEVGLKKFIARFENNFTFRTQRKHTQNDFISRINPLPEYINDSTQMNQNTSLRNTLSFNRSNPKFGIDYTYNYQNRKSLLTNGFDASDTKDHQIKMRWNISSEITVLNNLQQQQNHYNSEFFSAKNYTIESINNQASVQWQPALRLRFTAIYKIKDKKNILGGESVFLQEIGPEIKLNSPKKGSISLKVSAIINKYDGEQNSAVAYTLLEGYQPGENYRWTINMARNLNKFLRLNINYTGRKPADNSIIHTGQFSLSAFF